MEGCGTVTFTLCLHGAESTGKTVLAEKLGRELAIPWVPEFGRQYAEEHGTSFTVDDLLAIARGQEQARCAAAASKPPLLLLDTDPLMTAVWAEMLFGEIPDELFAYPKADHYLLFAPDVPWRDDGTRMFGSDPQRARFAALAQAVLERVGVPFTPVAGDWAAREAAVRHAIGASRA